MFSLTCVIMRYGTDVTQEMIENLRGTAEQRMLTDLRELSVKGRDLEFRGQHGETPVRRSLSHNHLLYSVKQQHL